MISFAASAPRAFTLTIARPAAATANTTTAVVISFFFFRAICAQLAGPTQVPAEIGRPDYAVDGIPKGKGSVLPWVIEVKKEDEIAAMRAAGRVAR